MLDNGYIWASVTFALYTVFAVVPIVALLRADRQRRWLALGACVLVLAVSLPHFTTTPDGVLQDTLEYAGGWKDRLGGLRATWAHFFSHVVCVLGTGWNVYPVWVGRYLSGTWLAERVIGLGWHLVLVVSLATIPLTPIWGVPISVAIVAATRFGLWLQRHHMGSDLLVQQALLLAALWRAERSRSSAVAAGCLTALGLYNYAAAMIWVAYPVLVLWRAPRRLLLVYAVALVVALPALLTFGTPAVDSLLTVAEYAQHTRLAVRALWDVSASQQYAWLWSYTGAQHLPLIACVVIAIGMVVALFSSVGRTWIALAGIGFLPAIVSNAPGASHREMMVLVPLAVLGGYSVRLVPKRFRTGAAVVFALAIAFAGYADWRDPQFWDTWRWNGFHGFVDESMTRGVPW